MASFNDRSWLMSVAVVAACSWSLATAQENSQQTDLTAGLIEQIEVQLAAERAARARAPKNAAAEDLAEAMEAVRRNGWRWAKVILPLLDVNKEGFPAIHALHQQIGDELNHLDPEAKISEWKQVDVDKLTRDNPLYWDALYQAAPGSGVLEALYASMLMGNGELVRAQQVCAIAHLGTFAAPVTKQLLSTLIASGKVGISAGHAEIRKGIELFDKQQYEAAGAQFQSVLTRWPEYGLAHFELGLTQFFQDEIAAGRPAPELGAVYRQGEKSPFSPAVLALYAKARKHDPLLRNAYQGEGTRVKLFLMVRGVIPAFQHISVLNRSKFDDTALEVFAVACQRAELHDYALLMRQVQVSRRDPRAYQVEDHAFIAASLRAMAPGAPTEAALKRLAGSKLVLHRFGQVVEGQDAKR